VSCSLLWEVPTPRRQPGSAWRSYFGRNYFGKGYFRNRGALGRGYFRWLVWEGLFWDARIFRGLGKLSTVTNRWEEKIPEGEETEKRGGAEEEEEGWVVEEKEER